MTKVSVVILHIKDAAVTRECLASVKKLKTEKLRVSVVIVDNGSGDEFPGYEVIRTGKNLGYAGGNNVGIKKSLADGADFIWILNNDTVVDPDCLENLVAAAGKHPGGGVFSPKIFFAPGYEFQKKYTKADSGRVLWWAGGRFDWANVMTVHRGVDEVDAGRYDREEETGSVAGTAMFVRRQVFGKTGLFNEKYFLYFEESDFCLRAGKAGFELWYVPTAVVWHKNAGSSGAGSDLHDYYITRNRLLFGLMHAPVRSKAALARQAVGLLVSGRYWQKRGVIDFLTGRLDKGSFPV